MKFNLLITGAPYDSDAGHRAWQFARAALAAGHEIVQVFFYQAAAHHGSCLSATLADEFDAAQQWQQFGDETGTKLVVCVSAGERRGVLNTEQQAELNKPSNNLADQFQVEGLASFYAACLEADRTVTFK